MQPTLRTLRLHLQNAGHAPLPLTKRQAETRARILTLAQCLMAEFGAKSIKFATLAAALRISPATLRFHFADLDDLLAALLAQHLDSVAAALAERPASAETRRAAYRSATRTTSGALTEPHRLLLRDRRALPADERARIETSRRRIATLLACGSAPLPRARPAKPPTAAPQKNPRPRPPRVTREEARQIRIEQFLERTQQILAQAGAAMPVRFTTTPNFSRQNLLMSSAPHTYPAPFTLQPAA